MSREIVRCIEDLRDKLYRREVVTVSVVEDLLNLIQYIHCDHQFSNEICTICLQQKWES